MNQHNRIKVIDASGWHKEYSLQKTIVHIGSAPRNDIVLEPVHGGGVASLHVQLIASGNSLGCKLVNLADTDILIGNQVLPPRSVIRLTDGATFELGGFTLVFCGGDTIVGGSAGGSRNIGLSIYMSQTSLAADQSLWGTVNVHNQGDQSGVQFDVSLEGMETDCFDIEPGPLLSAGAEKEVQFRLYHRGIKPLAGERTISIRVSAPSAYPTEEATMEQIIQVLPCYRHQIRVLTSKPAEADPSLQAKKDGEDEPALEPSAKPSSTQVIWDEESPSTSADEQPEPVAQQQQPVKVKPPPLVSSAQVDPELSSQELLPPTPPPPPSPEPSPSSQEPLAPTLPAPLPEPEPSSQPLSSQPAPSSPQAEPISSPSSPKDPSAEIKSLPSSQASGGDEEALETMLNQPPESSEDWWAETK